MERLCRFTVERLINVSSPPTTQCLISTENSVSVAKVAVIYIIVARGGHEINPLLHATCAATELSGGIGC